ncbi:MAG TPA: ABC transporter permease [Microlunatus sp.]|nr:ABC transporter permease [Microlunatus sp.]
MSAPGLDLSPAPGAAPARRRVLHHARTEATLLVRNGEQLLLALVIPIGLLVLGRVIGGTFGDLSVLAPSVLALAVWSSAFTSVAISTGFERRYGVLERLACTPLGRSGLLAGKAVATSAIVLGQLVLIALAALGLGWRPSFTPTGAVLSVVVVVFAGVAFSGLALALAGRLRAEATLALANVIYVLLLAGGALVLPLDRYPAALQTVIALLPTAALGEGLRAYAIGATVLWPLVSLVIWSGVGLVAARKGFRWTS